MDSSGGDKEVWGDEKITKQGLGRGRSQLYPEKLRRPRNATASQSSTGSNSSTTITTTQLDQKEKKYVLSPQAAEFVPRFRLSQSSLPQPPYQKIESSIQDRIRLAREAPPNVPLPPEKEVSVLENSFEQQCNIQNKNIGNYNNHEIDQYDNEDKQQNEETCKETYLFEEDLYIIIDILIVNPAEFSNLVPPFIDRIMSSGDVYFLQIVMTTIIEWSIAESNFRYNGARFFEYWDTSLGNFKEYHKFSKELFRDSLCYQCKWQTGIFIPEWFKQPEDQRDQRKCNGLILFLAELVAQMDESYAFILGEILISFITKVLQRPASSSVKYICQALKLAGHVLEKDKSRSKDMENMMRALTELVNNGQVDTHVGNMVNSVHELRKDWGNASNCDLSKSNNSLLNEIPRQPDQLGASNYNSPEMSNALLKDVQYPVSQQISLNQPVMYGPDGEILSAEESEFLQEHVKSEDQEIWEGEEIEDDNFDDEIAIAYEEFLKDKC
ncbi:hypothetical protein P5V15_008729 [Pogonomyrmex californicus]